MRSSQTTSIGPAGPQHETNRSPWNSLEFAKVVMTLATPLALFFLGMTVSNRQRSDDRKLAETAQSALAQEKRENAARQSQAEADRIDREDRIRAESAKLQHELQDAALAREKDLRDEAFRREEAVRVQQLELAKTSQLGEKRIEFWEKLAPKLAQIDRAIDDILALKGNMDEVSKLFRECDDLFGLYRPYFSPDFSKDYLSYKEKTRLFVDMLQTSGSLQGMVAHDGALQACNSYIRLRDSAAYEVAKGAGMLKEVSGAPSYDWAYFDCDQRSTDVMRIVEARTKPTG
ncbi:MAG TPA: hypothetical protein VFH89_03395 [Sphingomicrobium sp.]|nr:hypothetical protein [Sphingomicrobium sp.]